MVEAQNFGDGYTIQESWLAKLGQWKEALERYETRLEQNPGEIVAILGKLKCLDALGRWKEAIDLCMENLDLLRSHGGMVTRTPVSTVDKHEGASATFRTNSDGAGGGGGGGVGGKDTFYLEKAAVIGARCAWSLNDWSLMETLVSELPEENTDASLMRAVLTVHSEDYVSACFITKSVECQMQ